MNGPFQTLRTSTWPLKKPLHSKNGNFSRLKESNLYQLKKPHPNLLKAQRERHQPKEHRKLRKSQIIALALSS
jgi:hypothetical protein